MTRFEYVAIFFGIVVALSLENIAASFHKLVEAGGRVRWHWMAPTNAIGIAIATLGQFWLWWVQRDSMWGSGHPVFFLMFVFSALAAFLLYLACAATLPDEVPETGIDLREFYLASRRQVWGLTLVFVLVKAFVNLWYLVQLNFDPQILRVTATSLVALLPAGILAASMIYVRATWWHAIGITALTTGTVLFLGPLRL